MRCRACDDIIADEFSLLFNETEFCEKCYKLYLKFNNNLDTSQQYRGIYGSKKRCPTYNK